MLSPLTYPRDPAGKRAATVILQSDHTRPATATQLYLTDPLYSTTTPQHLHYVTSRVTAHVNGLSSNKNLSKQPCPLRQLDADETQ